MSLDIYCVSDAASMFECFMSRSEYQSHRSAVGVFVWHQVEGISPVVETPIRIIFNVVVFSPSDDVILQ